MGPTTSTLANALRCEICNFAGAATPRQLRQHVRKSHELGHTGLIGMKEVSRSIFVGPTKAEEKKRLKSRLKKKANPTGKVIHLAYKLIWEMFFKSLF
jgi:hypothetical protein